MTTQDHTPTPWHVEAKHGAAPEILAAGRQSIAQVRFWSGSEDAAEVYANAEFIVRSVNTLDELLEAAQAAVISLDAAAECACIEGYGEMQERFKIDAQRTRAAIRDARGNE